LLGFLAAHRRRWQRLLLWLLRREHCNDREGQRREGWPMTGSPPACDGASGATERLTSPAPSRVHHLKTVPPFYEEVVSGRKTVEVRKDDRDFQAGDTLVLHEYDRRTQRETGRWTTRLVTHVLRGWGVEDGYVAMSITDRLTALDATPESAEVQP
jgi:hypothetical protein